MGPSQNAKVLPHCATQYKSVIEPVSHPHLIARAKQRKWARRLTQILHAISCNSNSTGAVFLCGHVAQDTPLPRTLASGDQM